MAKQIEQQDARQDERKDAQAKAVLAAARVIGSFTIEGKQRAKHDCCRALIESLRS